MGFATVILKLLLVGNVAVVTANNCWQTTVTVHYTVGPSTISVSQNEANNLMNEVLSVGKGQLSCSGLTLKLLSVTIGTPGNLYSISGSFGVIYGNMNANQKQTAKSCLTRAVIFNDIVLRPDYYTSPLKGSHWADRAALTNFQDTTCCPNGTIVVNGACVSSIAPTSTAASIPQNATIVAQASTRSIAPSPSPTPTYVTIWSTVYLTSCFSTTPTRRLVYPTQTLSQTFLIANMTSSPSSQWIVPVTLCCSTLYITSCESPILNITSTESSTNIVFHAPLSSTQSSSSLIPESSTNIDFTTVSSTMSSSSSILVPSSTQSSTSLIPESSTNIDFTTVSSTMSSSSSILVPSSTQSSTSLIPEPFPNLSSAVPSSTQSSTSLIPESSTNIDFTPVSSTMSSSSSILVPPPPPTTDMPTTAPPTTDTPTTAPEPTTSVFLNFVNFVTTTQVSLGDTVKIFCAVMTTAYDVQMFWTRDERVESNVQSLDNGVNYTHSLLLTITNVTTPQVGEYTCKVDSSIGTYTKRFTLKVKVSDQVNMAMALKNVKFHSDLLNSSSPRYVKLSEEFSKQAAAVFNSRMKGLEKIVVTGLRSRNGSVIVDFTVFTTRVLASPLPSSPDLVKEISNVITQQVTTGSFGNYTVSNDSLVLKIKPPPPRNIRIPEKGTKFMRIEWEQPLNWMAYRIQKYIIWYKKRTSSDFNNRIKMDNKTFSKTIEGLEVDTRYDFQMYSENSIGQGPSSPVIRDITFSVTPVIANDGQKFTVNEGKTVVLVCSGSSDPRPEQVTWERKPDRLLESDLYSNITGNNKILNKYMTLRNVKIEDAGYYECSATWKDVTKNGRVALIVIVSDQVKMEMSLKHEEFHSDLLNSSSPRYIKLSEDFTKQANDVFGSDKLKGYEKTVVTGLRQGSVIVDFIVFITKALSSPTTNRPDLVKDINTFMIQQVNTGNFGSYNVSIDSLFLRVKPPPPTNIRISDEEKGTKFMIIRWEQPLNWKAYRIQKYIIRYKKQSSDNFDKRFEVDSGTFSKTIERLEEATRYDFQLYSENVIGQGPSSPIISAITFSVTPVIANDGQKFTVNEGKTVVLVCSGSSDPRPEQVTWERKPDRLLESDLYSNITGNNKILNKYMTLRNVKIEDAGYYECSATWRDKRANGRVALIVEVPVQVKLNATLVNETFTEELKNKSTPKFMTLKTKFETELSKLYRNVTGFEKVEVIGFTKGSVKVSFRVIVVVKVEEPKQQSKPTETKVDVTKRIIAKVKSSNGDLGGGLIVKKDSITTDSPPPSPRNVTVFEVKQTIAHLRWIEPEDADVFSVTNYVIKLKKHGPQFNWKDKRTVEDVQLDSSIDDLEDGTSYTVKVMARGDGGDGLDSAQEEFRTREVKINLIWLWICLGLLLVVGVIALVVYRYKKRVDADKRFDANGDRPGIRRTTSIQLPEKEDVCIYSYRNETFQLGGLDFECPGMMPGKWWEIPRNQLILGKTLGSGAFGMVKKGTIQLDNGDMACAVKMLKNSAGEEETRDLINELEIMAGIGTHANLVNLIGACSYGGPFLIVLEFAEGGTLLDYVKSNITSMLNEDQACSLPDEEKIQIGLDIARGMKHLAHVKCVHRDLAARNVLLTGNKTAKVADFGMSRDVYERGFYEKQSQGKLPVRWMAPEAIQQMMFTTKGDIWSYGVVLWEIESGGKLPYGGLGMLELIDYLKKGKRLAKPSRCREGIYNLMLHCWHMDPNQRPNFDVICTNMDELRS